ncbi:hypothetical protein B0H14DRAFT_3463241 [Mycena olivaceomarginata]|nr:hypothetical protein B0H14DRAFT_3463241 [Mycena olivaceomarginata]
MCSKNQPSSPVIPTTASRRAIQPSIISHAAHSQAAGLAHLNELSRSLSGQELDSAPSASTPSQELTEAEKAEAEGLAEIEDRRIVEEELAQCEAEGILNEWNPESLDFDLLRYWQEFVFPMTLYLVALDVLSPTVMEMLQILKFIY